MNKNLAMELGRVTEAAALAGFDWLGRGDKNAADAAAVEAMRTVLNESAIDGEIVIGEGEIDNAPMLYIGEKVGLGGVAIDIAVDPIEGTRMTAMGQANALAVIAAGDKGTFLKAPDMYMEKLIVGPKAKTAINLNLSLIENVKRVSKALNKALKDMVIVTLDKERHNESTQSLRDLGVKVFAIPDGDVAATVLTCLEEYDVDLMYCIGGAPEGVVSAAIVQALGGGMNARLLTRNTVKGDNQENNLIAKQEAERCQQMGVEVDTVLQLDDLVKSKDVVFAATGLTAGDLLDGVRCSDNTITTETMIIDGRLSALQRLKSTYHSNPPL